LKPESRNMGYNRSAGISRGGRGERILRSKRPPRCFTDRGAKGRKRPTTRKRIEILNPGICEKTRGSPAMRRAGDREQAAKRRTGDVRRDKRGEGEKSPVKHRISWGKGRWNRPLFPGANEVDQRKGAPERGSTRRGWEQLREAI